MNDINEDPLNFLQDFYEKYNNTLKKKMIELEDIIIDDREKNNIPIYMTRSRIKLYESAYIKCHKKNKTSIKELTDIIGIRVLCLFPQDLIPTYKYLLHMLDTYSENIDEVKIYHDKKIVKYEDIFNENIDTNKHSVEKCDFAGEEKVSGYQSIHIVGSLDNPLKNNCPFPFELQLRTLLQDVWGELEHKIGYKNNNQHFFISKGFELLSRNLDTNDMLISTLYDLSNKYTPDDINKKLKIGNPLRYDYSLISTKIAKYPSLHGAYKEYLHNLNAISDIKKQEDDYRTLVNNIYNEVGAHSTEDKDILFWIDMEKAFFLLYENPTINNITDAKHIYNKHIESYVSQFRLGQIALHENKTIEALKYFDTSKRLNLKLEDDSNASINRLKLFVNITLIYWLHGHYRTGITDELNTIIELFTKYEKDITDNQEKDKFINSITWYLLEDLKNNRDTSFDDNQLDSYLNKLIGNTACLKDNEEDINNETYDTIAMCYLYKYKKSTEESDIKEAFDYIKKAYKYKGTNTYYDSHDLIVENYQTIKHLYRQHLTNSI